MEVNTENRGSKLCRRLLLVVPEARLARRKINLVRGLQWIGDHGSENRDPEELDNTCSAIPMHYASVRNNAANLSSSCRFKSDTTQQFIPATIS